MQPKITTTASAVADARVCSVCRQTEERNSIDDNGPTTTTTTTTTIRLARCSRCRGPELYCGRACQEWDWKRRHRKLCQARVVVVKRQQQQPQQPRNQPRNQPQQPQPQNQRQQPPNQQDPQNQQDQPRNQQPPPPPNQQRRVWNAWRELSELVQTSSVSDATHDYHVALDQVQQQEQQQEQMEEQLKPKDKDDNDDDATTLVDDDDDDDEATLISQDDGRNPAEDDDIDDDDDDDRHYPQGLWKDWSITIQDLTQLSCFQIQLQAAIASGDDDDDNDDQPRQERLTALLSSSNDDCGWTCQPMTTTTTTTARKRQWNNKMNIDKNKNRPTRMGLYYSSKDDEDDNQQRWLVASFDVPATIDDTDSSHLATTVRVATSHGATTEDDGDHHYHHHPTATTTVSIRLSYLPHRRQAPVSDNDRTPAAAATARNPRDYLNGLTCGSCHDENERAQNLMTPLFQIQKHNQETEEATANNKNGTDLFWYRLPTGHWQDISEHITCSGRQDVMSFLPHVDTTSTTTTNDPKNDAGPYKGIGWNDGYIMCSASFLNNRGSFPLLSVLEGEEDEARAIEQAQANRKQGYEADGTEFTNDATWKPSALSETTTDQAVLRVACSRCCTTLGWCQQSMADASEQQQQKQERSDWYGTVYLMRHTLSTTPSTPCPQNLPLVFWVHELIHLAETQGVFTLLIYPHPSSNTRDPDKDIPAVWIRVWQWNTFQARGRKKTKDKGGCHLSTKWHRLAKLVYQTAPSLEDFLPSSSSSSTATTMLACLGGSSCEHGGIHTRLPLKSDGPQSASSSRIVTARLDDWEFQQVTDCLQKDCNLLNQSENAGPTALASVKTTFWAQTGQKPNDDSLFTMRKAGVAHVPLES